MFQPTKLTSLYSPVMLGSSANTNPSGSSHDKELEGLRIERNNLNQRIMEQQQQIDKLTSNSYFNSDLIRENQELRERVTYFQTEFEKKKKENFDLEMENRSLRNKQTTPYTAQTNDILELQRKVERLNRENADMENTISDLRRRNNQLSYQYGTKTDLQKVNEILDRCQMIANRMLDVICQTLPGWNASSAELREIRSDVVCSLENVETILKELINQRSESSSSPNIVDQFVLEERDQLKRELQSSSNNENLISDLYLAVMNHSTYVSTEEKLKVILSSVNQLLSQLHVSSFNEIFSEINRLQSEKVLLEQELREYKKLGPIQYNYSQNPVIDYSLTDLLISFCLFFDETVDLLDNDMNRASVVFGIPIQKEENRCVHSEQELQKMEGSIFIRVCEGKKRLLHRRIQDMNQFTELLMNQLQKEREIVETKTRMASAVIDGWYSPNQQPPPLASSQPVDLFARREKDNNTNQIIEDCYKYICIESDMKTAIDRYNIRSTAGEALLSRIRSSFSVGSLSSNWSSSDTLLLLNRMIQTEYDLKQLKEKQSLFVEDMMRVENQRDESVKQEQKTKEDLLRCEGQLSQAKLDLQKKEGEVAEWKKLALSNSSNPGPSVPYLAPQGVPQVQTLSYTHSEQEIRDIIQRVKSKVMSIYSVMFRLNYAAKAISSSSSLLTRGMMTSLGNELHVFSSALTRKDEQRRSITTVRNNPILPLAIGCGVAGCCLVAKYVVERAENYKNKTDGNGEHTYAFANYYQGGFEKEMTKREAALILGVRTNSDPKRIQKAYRTILLKNHPDKGGSPYLAAKVNQAKDILLGLQEGAK